jgi:WD40 repeat protein
VAFSHDSTLLASGSYDTTVKIWDASSGECLRTLEHNNDEVYSVAFSHDSTSLASGSYDSVIKIWNIRNGECLQTLQGHRAYVNSLAFSRDSTLLASASDDSTVKIWNVGNGECLQTLDTCRAHCTVSMDTTVSCVHTDIGPECTCQGGAVSADGVWITLGSKNLFRLPAEYRPSCSAVSGNKIGIGVGSGKVWICDIDLRGCKQY